MSKIIEVNCETGEHILRDMTDEELVQQEKDIAEAKKAEDKAKAKATAKAALLERLGINEEEAKLLLG